MIVDHSLNIKKNWKCKETGDSRYIYQNESDKACFQHDTVYGVFKDLNRARDKVLRDKAFNITKNPKYHGYQYRLASVAYEYFDKKTSGGIVKNEVFSNNELAKELYTNQLLENLRKQKYAHLL